MLTGKEFAKQFSKVEKQKEFASVRSAKKAIATSIRKEIERGDGKNYLDVIRGRGGKMARAAFRNRVPSEDVVNKISNAAVKSAAKATKMNLSKDAIKKAVEITAENLKK